LAPLVGASALRGAGSAVQKTVELLQKMVDEGQKTMNSEQVSWAAREQWCSGTIQSLKEEIEGLMEDKDSNNAEIAAADGKMSELAELIAEENGKVSAATKRKAHIKAEREKTHKSFLVEQRDLSESVSALDRAIMVIAQHQQSHGKVEQASFLQASAGIPENIRGLALSMLEATESDTQVNPKAAAYRSSAGGVLELLEKTLDEFKEKLHECEMGELNSRQNWELETQTLVDSIRTSEAAIEAHQEASGEQGERKANAQEKLSAVVADLKNTKKEYSTTSTMCNSEKKSYDEKQGLRRDEISALNQAIEILTTRVTGRLALNQQSLIQLRDSSSNDRASAAKISLYLSKQSDKLKSKTLSLLAEKIAEDPFVKVRDMIEGMIEKLQKEAGEEQKLHIFCTNSMDKVRRKLKKYNTQADKHSAAMSEAAAKAAQAAASHKKLTGEVKELRAALDRATADRNEAAKVFEAELTEAQDVEAALGEAIQVLKDFYSKAAFATAFLQVPNLKPGGAAWNRLGDPNAPEQQAYGDSSSAGVEDSGHTAGEATFGEAYSGKQDSAGAIIAILESALSTASMEIMKLKEAEALDKTNFEKYAQETAVAIAEKSTRAANDKTYSLEQKTKATAAKEALGVAEEQIRAAQTEWDALLPQCPRNVGGTKDVITHEERQAQRQAEIDSLKQCLEILA